MKTKLAAFAAALTLPFTVIACGGDSGLDRDELIAQGDQICKESGEALREKTVAMFQESPSVAEMIRFVKKEVLPTYRDELAGLKALDPDGDSADDWNAMIEKLDTGISQLADDPAAAVKGGISPLDEAGQAARDFGMKVCGTQD